jgi:natural product precursor
MKKVNLTGKLSLKKETIAKLNNEQMNVVKGGRPNTNTCGSGCMIAETGYGYNTCMGCNMN